MVPIKHKKCSGITAWYLRDSPRDPDVLLSKDYMRMDGTQPSYGSVTHERCASCGALIAGMIDLKRDFSDVRPMIDAGDNFLFIKDDG